MQEQLFRQRCLKIRSTIIDTVQAAGRGHIPSAFSIVEILTILYDHILNIDPKRPCDKNRDRFILSKGHGCLALYAILADLEFFSGDHLQSFCKFDGFLGGHPEEKVPGVEATTGSLGHGLSIGIGFALNAKLEGLRYQTFVLLGDGECDEGSIWEGALSAAQNRLDNLVVLVDYNKHMSYDATRMVCDLEPFADKWRAFGFEVGEVDMVHNPIQLFEILQGLRQNQKKPAVIICHTVKGMGVPFMENNLEWHHKSKISYEQIEAMRRSLQ